MIHSIGMVRLRQRIFVESGFRYRKGSDMRSMIHFILMHAINMASKLPDHVYGYEECRVIEKARLALRDNLRGRNNSYETGTATCIECETRDTYNVFSYNATFTQL